MTLINFRKFDCTQFIKRDTLILKHLCVIAIMYKKYIERYYFLEAKEINFSTE